MGGLLLCKELLKREVTKKMKEIVKITNYKQASYYIREGVKPVDLFYTDRIVFVFNAEETKPVWDKWRTHEAEI